MSNPRTRRAAGAGSDAAADRLQLQGASSSAGRWFLESFVDGKRTSRVPITRLPFRVGRQPGLGLTLASDLVSKEHAEVCGSWDELRVRDLGSTNGTFVNRGRVSEAVLGEGDIIHFAHFEFRLARWGSEQESLDATAGDRTTTPVSDLLLPAQLGVRARQLEELLQRSSVRVVFQPIVSLPEAKVIAHEALGRGRHLELPEGPMELLTLAAGVGLERDLSRLFRVRSFDALRDYAGVRHFFLNVHTSELLQPELIESLQELQAGMPPARLTLEVHESAVVDPVGIASLRSRLADVGVGLAYDDFGAGQPRLRELAEVPPDYLKFDMSLIQGIHSAGPSRRKLLQSLVAMARELSVLTVAEGIESQPDAVACVELGFDCAQGYYFGRPSPLDGA